jgi:hypothetical protein
MKKCFKWKLLILMIYLSANILFDEAIILILKFSFMYSKCYTWTIKN